MSETQILKHRVCGFKIGFNEMDIRKYRGRRVLYLDSSSKYPVPDLLEDYPEGFFWERKSEDTRVKIENMARNRQRSPGGLSGYFPKNASILLVGGVGSIPPIPKLPSGWCSIGLGPALSAGVNFYFFNHPSMDAMDWIKSKPTKWPVGIFSYGGCPDFVSKYRGLKFFYGSGWETRDVGPKLIDLIDPLSAIFHQMVRSETQRVLLINMVNTYAEPRPGTVPFSSGHLYPQQVLGLSLLSALIFWATKAGVRIYTTIEGLGETPDEAILEILNKRVGTTT